MQVHAALLVALSAITVGTSEIINELVDEQLEAINALNARNGLDPTKLGDDKFPNGVEFYRGLLFGLSDLRREGDSSITEEGNDVHYLVRLRAPQLKVALASVRTASGRETAAHFTAPDNLLVVDFTVTARNGPDCDVRVNRLAFDELGKTAASTAVAVGQEDMAAVESVLLEYINKEIGWIREELKLHLRAICWSS